MSGTEYINRQLERIIQAAFDIPRETDELDIELLPTIETIASRQSILQIVVVGLRKMGFQDHLSETMKRHSVQAVYNYVQRQDALEKVSAALENEGVDYIPLKGSVLRELYPQPSMRESSDIDILVHEEDLKKAISTIEKSTSFKFYRIAHHDAHFVNERVHLELHFSLMSNIEKLDHILFDPWQYSQKSGQGHLFVFTPEFHIYYITAHAAKHFMIDGGMGIRPLLDLWLLRTKMDYNEECVRSLCSESGILKYYEACCQLLRVWFAGESHNDFSTAFEDFVFSGGVFGSNHTKVLFWDRKTKHANQKYTVSRVVRSKKDIQEFYPRSKRHPSLVPFYQVVRWTRLIKPSKRKAARKELRLKRSLDPVETERYDQLLEKLGF